MERADPSRRTLAASAIIALAVIECLPLVFLLVNLSRPLQTYEREMTTDFILRTIIPTLGLCIPALVLGLRRSRPWVAVCCLLTAPPLWFALMSTV